MLCKVLAWVTGFISELPQLKISYFTNNNKLVHHDNTKLLCVPLFYWLHDWDKYLVLKHRVAEHSSTCWKHDTCCSCHTVYIYHQNVKYYSRHLGFTEVWHFMVFIESAIETAAKVLLNRHSLCLNRSVINVLLNQIWFVSPTVIHFCKYVTYPILSKNSEPSRFINAFHMFAIKTLGFCDQKTNMTQQDKTFSFNFILIIYRCVNQLSRLDWCASMLCIMNRSYLAHFGLSTILG